MPITVKPKKNESKEAFLKRCRVNHEVIKAAKNRGEGKKVGSIIEGICRSIWAEN